MKAIRKTINVLFVIWTSCALTHANQGTENTINPECIKSITCSQAKKTIDNKQLEINVASTNQFSMSVLWLDLLKWNSMVSERKENVFEIVTIEG